MKIDETNPNVISYLKKLSENPWVGTIMEGYYNVNNKVKGTKGEEIVEELLKSINYEVKPRTSAGHDRIINGVKTEIKFSAATKRNNDYEFTFNHIGLNKDWDEIIFCGINGDLEIKMICFNRDTFPFELFNAQQGGQKSNNDDYMCTGAKTALLMFHENGKILF